MAITNNSTHDVTISAEAVDLLSRLGDGFDDIILKVAEVEASSRPEGNREVTAADIQKALSSLCAVLMDFLKSERSPQGDQREALSNLLDYFKSLGAC